MALGNLHQWNPALIHIDPRPQDKFSVGAKYCVVSVSRHPTFNELKMNGETIANSKMVGLIQSFAAPQARPIFRLFEMGSRYPYTVAGKFMGTISLTSMMFDAGANLLGGIYEEVFSSSTSASGAPNLTPSGIELINHPDLYDPDSPNPSMPVNYSMQNVGSSTTGPSKSWGAIRMSLDDNRLDVPFGLVFTIFQNSRRIKANVQNEEGNLTIDNDATGADRYRIMSCMFFEMVRVQAYDFQVTAEQEVLYESASFYYHGLVNVKTTAKVDSGQYAGRTGYDSGITNNTPPTSPLQ